MAARSKQLRGWLVTSIAVSALFGPMVVTASAAGGLGLVCQPGSGPQLAGHRLTQADIARYEPDSLRCADLAGANLSGLSLIQIDLTGADLRNADLAHADLTQATLDGADLSDANLSDATLLQTSARAAKFDGANLSNVNLTQADLTGADLSGAKLGGSDFSEADIGQANFKGATGLTPWSLYLLIAAAALFVALAWQTFRRSRRFRPGRSGMRGLNRAAGLNDQIGLTDQIGLAVRTGLTDQIGFVGRTGVTGVRQRLVPGLLGALLIALGFHLFVGGLMGVFLPIIGPPVTQTCAGPQCIVGVGSGLFGPVIGVFVLLIGLGVRRAR